MVILIGGVSCTGKTTMAQRILEKYHIPYLSIDHVKMGIFRGSRYCDFTPEDSDDELNEKLWPIIKGIIMTNIENDQNIIIEGCYLPTDRVLDFEDDYRNQIIPLYIGFSEEYIKAHIEDGILSHRSETEYKELDDYMNKDLFIKEHKKQKERCTADNLMYFEVTEDYTKDLLRAYEWIDKQVKEKKDLRFNQDN